MKRWCDTEKLIKAILEEAGDDPLAIHGVSHWKRVQRNGVWIGKRSGAELFVVELFAWFHDSQRWNDGYEPGHGKRGGEFAKKLKGRFFDIEDESFDKLYYTCEWHTDKRLDLDATVGTCWDADRHDLGRVGEIPLPEFMNTDFGRKAAVAGSFYDLLDEDEKSEPVAVGNFAYAPCLS